MLIWLVVPLAALAGALTTIQAGSNAALKKLFSDPHFNVMDGLDTYIDDYGKPDPIPPSMLRAHSQNRRGTGQLAVWHAGKIPLRNSG